jgi:hypothetical protein
VQKEAGGPEVEYGAVEMKHKVHSASEVETVVKLAARIQLATTRQGAFESIIAFKQRYTNSLKAYRDQKNPAVAPQDEVIDFFSELDNVRYAELKTTYINSLQLESCKPPVDLKDIFTLANTYLKPKVAASNGLRSTLLSTADYVDKKERQNKRCRGNQKDETPGKNQEQGKNSDAST